MTGGWKRTRLEGKSGFTWLSLRKLARSVEGRGDGRASRGGRVQELAGEKAGDYVWVMCILVVVWGGYACVYTCVHMRSRGRAVTDNDCIWSVAMRWTAHLARGESPGIT